MDSALITVLANAGVAGVVVILMILGWLVPKPTVARLEAENTALRTSRDTERQRADEAVQAGRVTTQLIAALADLAAARRQDQGWPAGFGGPAALPAATPPALEDP